MEPRDPLKYEGRDLPVYNIEPPLNVLNPIDYIDHVKCPNTGIDQRYCTCLACGRASQANQSAIKGTAA